MKIFISLLIIVFYTFSGVAQTLWQFSGFADTMITCLSINSSGNILASTSDNILYYSDNNGTSWNKISEPDIILNFISLDDSNNIYIADTDAIGNGLQISLDLGQNWKVISDSGTLGCYSIGIKKPGEIFATFTGMSGENHFIYHSVDYGKNWNKDSINFTVSLLNNLSTQSVYTFDKKGFSYVIGNNGIYRLLNDGKSWVRKIEGLSAWIITTICLNKSEHIFIQGNFITSLGGLYTSIDNGDTWELLTTNGLPPFPDFYQLITDSNNTLYGITDDLFRSKDGGITWENVSEGLPSLITILAVSPSGNIFCGTNSGIYKSTPFLTSLKTDNNVNLHFSLKQNYPNPFNSMTQIEFKLSFPENIELKIYDVLGKEISTLVKDYQQAGIHNINFDASNLSSGIYFYMLKTKSSVDTKKMILLK